MINAAEKANDMQVVEAIENNKQQEQMKKDFVERMVKEHDELDVKRKKLDKFIKSPKFKTLDNENKFLLCAQLNSMANYQMILYRRIALNSRGGGSFKGRFCRTYQISKIGKN